MTNLRRIISFLILFAQLFFMNNLSAQSDTNQPTQKYIESIIENSNKVNQSTQNYINTIVENANENNFEKTIGLLKSKRELLVKNNSNDALLLTTMIIEQYIKNEVFNNSLIQETFIGEELSKKTKNYYSLIDMLTFRAGVYNELNIKSKSIQYVNEALAISLKLEDETIRKLYQTNLNANLALNYFEINDNKNYYKYFNRSQKVLNSIQPTNQDDVIFKNLILSQLDLLKGKFEKKEKNYVSSEVYLLKALKYSDKFTQSFLNLIRLETMNELSDLHYKKKDYKKAILFAKKCINDKKGLISNKLKKQSFELLSQSYLEINQIDSSKYYSKLFVEINDSINLRNQKLNVESLDEIKIAQENKEKSNQRKYLYYFIFSILFLIPIVYFVVRNEKKKTTVKFNKIIDHLNEEKLNQFHIKSVVDNKNVKSEISEDTYNSILSKLEKFEISQKFINNKINLTTLATSFNTNTKYLSQIIYLEKGKNFNNYINSLRINYILQKLYLNEEYRLYKIDYLAKCSGFSSRAVFTSIFTKEVGMNPSIFIKLLNTNDSTSK